MCVYGCMCLCMYVGMYACVYVCVCLCTYAFLSARKILITTERLFMKFRDGVRLFTQFNCIKIGQI